jgi:hypothetical protein
MQRFDSNKTITKMLVAKILLITIPANINATGAGTVPAPVA